MELAGVLGLKTIAEGIESPAQLEQLRALGCGLAQGFLLARPLGEDQMAPLIGGIGPRPRMPVGDELARSA